MNITKLVRDVKENESEESFNKLVKHYEEYFCSKVANNYGEEYRSRAKEALPALVRYYFDNNIKGTVSNYLGKKSYKVFSDGYSFDDIIKSENKERVRKYYIKKFYRDIQKENVIVYLTKEELLELSKYIVSNMYNNYISSEKKSHVSSYFDALIKRKVKLFNDEEKLLLYYIGIFGSNSRIKLYFYDKYSYMLEEIGYEQYKKIIDDILVKKENLMIINVERNIIIGIKKYKACLKLRVEEEIKNLALGNPADTNLIKEHYSYIKKLVYNKFSDKVTVCKKRLIQEIDEKYDEYLTQTINNIANKIVPADIYLPEYINRRLSSYVKDNKSFYKVYYLDDNAFNMINSNINIVDKFVKRYSRNIPEDVLRKILEEEYYISAYEYFTKERSRDFCSYVKSNLYKVAKEKNSSYIDDDNIKTIKK